MFHKTTLLGLVLALLVHLAYTPKAPGHPHAAPWTRTYKEPKRSFIDIPISIPVASLKQELIKGLPDTLADGKERVKLSKTVDVPVTKIVDAMAPGKVPVPRPKFKRVRPPFGLGPDILVPDGVEIVWVDRPVPGKKTIV